MNKTQKWSGNWLFRCKTNDDFVQASEEATNGDTVQIEASFMIMQQTKFGYNVAIDGQEIPLTRHRSVQNPVIKTDGPINRVRLKGV